MPAQKQRAGGWAQLPTRLDQLKKGSADMLHCRGLALTWWYCNSYFRTRGRMQGLPRLCQLRAGNKQEAALDAPVSPLPDCGRHLMMMMTNRVRLIKGSTAQHLSLLKAFLRDSIRNAQLPWPANGPDFVIRTGAGSAACLPVHCSTVAKHYPPHSFFQRYLHALPRPIRCGRAPVSLRPGLELPNWTPCPTGNSLTVAAAMFLRNFRRGLQVNMSSM